MTSKTGSSGNRASTPIRRRGQISIDEAASAVAATPKGVPPTTAKGSTRGDKPPSDRREEGWLDSDHDLNAERPWVLSP